jgi:hypothetical protein
MSSRVKVRNSREKVKSTYEKKVLVGSIDEEY